MLIIKWLKTLLTGVILTVLMSACTSPQQWNDRLYQQAKDNFTMQNYRQAFQQIQSPAKAGNPDAQYALGYMYYYGKGTVINHAQAAYWFQRAADQGQPGAKKALAMIAQQQGN